MVYNEYYPFKIIPLGFDYTALSPDIGEYTMFFHFNEHYVPAAEKLGRMILSMPMEQNVPLTQLAKSGDSDIQRAAGSVFAHEMFFSSLSGKEQEPSEYMKERIARSFGSEENLAAVIKDAADEISGSGYVWLVSDGSGNIVPAVTKDHELPDTERCKPVFAIDLWEHAYYPDFRSSREDYIGAALKHINWEQMEKNLKNEI